MKVKKIIVFSVLFVTLIGLIIAIPYSFQTIKSEPSWPAPEISSGKAVPLPLLVKDYESRMDPALPKITVTARYFGENCAVDYPLPYDGIVRTNSIETEADKNYTWFKNLYNNFWSLPSLIDEVDSNRYTPSRFTIKFSKRPDSSVTIIDYPVSGRGVAAPLDGTSEKGMSYLGNHTYTFEMDSNTLSFDLWDNDDYNLSSAPPYLRGFQIKCQFDGIPVEYYLLFRTNYNGTSVPEDLALDL